MKLASKKNLQIFQLLQLSKILADDKVDSQSLVSFSFVASSNLDFFFFSWNVSEKADKLKITSELRFASHR